MNGGEAKQNRHGSPEKIFMRGHGRNSSCCAPNRSKTFVAATRVFSVTVALSKRAMAQLSPAPMPVNCHQPIREHRVCFVENDLPFRRILFQPLLQVSISKNVLNASPPKLASPVIIIGGFKWLTQVSAAAALSGASKFYESKRARKNFE